jgi:hypothetical protein
MRKRYGGRSSIRNWRTVYYMYYTAVSIYEESHRKEAPKAVGETRPAGDDLATLNNELTENEAGFGLDDNELDPLSNEVTETER